MHTDHLHRPHLASPTNLSYLLSIYFVLWPTEVNQSLLYDYGLGAMAEGWKAGRLRSGYTAEDSDCLLSEPITS